MSADRTEVQVEGLEIGGMTAGTVRIGGQEVEIGPDGRPVMHEDGGQDR